MQLEYIVEQGTRLTLHMAIKCCTRPWTSINYKRLHVVHINRIAEHASQMASQAHLERLPVWPCMSTIWPLRLPIRSITGPTCSSGTSMRASSNGSHFLPSCSFRMTCRRVKGGLGHKHHRAQTTDSV